MIEQIKYKKTADNIKNELLSFVKEKDLDGIKKFIFSHKKDIDKIILIYGSEMNPYIKAPYVESYISNYHDFTLGYQEYVENLLGDNILFTNE